MRRTLSRDRTCDVLSSLLFGALLLWLLPQAKHRVVKSTWDAHHHARSQQTGPTTPVCVRVLGRGLGLVRVAMMAPPRREALR